MYNALKDQTHGARLHDTVPEIVCLHNCLSGALYEQATAFIIRTIRHACEYAGSLLYHTPSGYLSKMLAVSSNKIYILKPEM